MINEPLVIHGETLVNNAGDAVIYRSLGIDCCYGSGHISEECKESNKDDEVVHSYSGGIYDGDPNLDTSPCHVSLTLTVNFHPDVYWMGSNVFEVMEHLGEKLVKSLQHHMVAMVKDTHSEISDVTVMEKAKLDHIVQSNAKAILDDAENK
jgi:hypothetical protein